MIDNFVPADTTLTVKLSRVKWATVVGWSNTAEGLRPVVVDRNTPCHPRVLLEPAEYGYPGLSVTVEDGFQAYVEVEGSVTSQPRD